MFDLTGTQEWGTAARLKSRTPTSPLHICTFVPSKFRRSGTSAFKGSRVCPAHPLTPRTPFGSTRRGAGATGRPFPSQVVPAREKLKTRHFWYSELTFCIEFMCVHIQTCSLSSSPYILTDVVYTPTWTFVRFLLHTLLYRWLKQLSVVYDSS